MSGPDPIAPPVLWTPSPDQVEAATVTRFARWVESSRRVEVSQDYEHLWRWSVEDLGGFWQAVWDFFDVRASGRRDIALARRTMPGAQWFPGSRLTYAEHAFRDRLDATLALQHASELAGCASWSWGQLRDETAKLATGLRRLGVGPGDRVGAYLPHLPETIAAFLACASIGAVWSATAPEFGTDAVVDRFGQIRPKVLLAVDGYRYGGKDFDRRDCIRQLQAEIPSIEHVVVLDHLGSAAPAGTISWESLTSEAEELRFARVPFDHPLWVLYSSGTTGPPKPIVHGHGGMLLEHLKLANLHVDARAGDRVFWFTTTSWMMWNFLVGVLLTPASIVLYDGSPSGDTLWDLAVEAGVTIFGTSAAYVAACMKGKITPRDRARNLDAVRAVGSTGSPLSPEGFRWLYDHIGHDTWLFSMSGGTDVCTAFVGGVPTLPVNLGELQARALGAKVEAWDPDGNSLVGEVGELVITEPMPCMPVSFFGDEDGIRLRESYFDHYPGVWRHGDWIEITARGSAVIYGRSDSTINRGGVRMGTSEIYRAVLKEQDVVDALVVDVPRPGTDGWISLFVVLGENVRLSDALTKQIKGRIRSDCSPRHVPDEIVQVPDVPRTRSGKILEVPVKRILMGTPADQVVSLDSLENAAALDVFVSLARELA
jgi:acetoacetyl-CoA synthetase